MWLRGPGDEESSFWELEVMKVGVELKGVNAVDIYVPSGVFADRTRHNRLRCRSGESGSVYVR